MEKNKLEEHSLNILLNHKFNLFQQFLVVSIDPKVMYSINDYDLQSLQEPYSSPKVISKYPNANLPYLYIPDPIVALHCFPKGIINEIIEYENEADLKTKENKIESFIFSLENMCPEEKTNSLRTNKVYYTCLLFYENIENYRNCINKRKNYNIMNSNEVKNKNILIPKVICLSSFSPFYEQSKNILYRLKRYVNYFNYNNKSEKNINTYPIEKIIEGLIFQLPSLPRGNYSVKLSNDSFSIMEEYENKLLNSNSNALNSKYIIFQETPPNANPRETFNYSILMNYFRIEEIFDVIKFIILEEPILFFSEDKEALTNVIESLISLIYPFQYPYPVMPLLPEQNFSLISLFKHFIFGINYKYSEEVLNKKIILDGIKFVRIIRLDKRFNNILNSEEQDKLGYQIFTSIKFDENKPLIKFDQIEHNVYRNDKEEIKLIHEKKKVNLPRHYFEKCCRKLEKTIQEKFREIESKNKNQDKILINKLKVKAFNAEIREDFLYFFSCILLKYQEYIYVKYEKILYEYKDKNGNNVSKEYGERSIELDKKYYNNKIKLDDIFNSEEFINSTPSLDRGFYRIFFGTKIFFNFILKKIFPDSNQDKLDILYFDEIINKKLSRELYMQKKETKFLDTELNLKGEIEISSLKKQIEFDIDQYFHKKENRRKALNYFQYIYLSGEDDNNGNDKVKAVVKTDQIYFYYYVFPILLNDGIFYNEKYKKKISTKTWSFLEYSSFSQSSNRLYNNFEEESSIIIDDDDINKNYNLYEFSLNPTSQFRFTNDYLEKILWLLYLAKTFNSISISKKRYYFEILMCFLQKNRELINDDTIQTVFNSISRNGDRNMTQDYFPYMKNKTYTSYLCAREKAKLENNFVKYIINIENNKDKDNNTSNNSANNNNQKQEESKANIEKKISEDKYQEKKFLKFTVNSFCNAKIGRKKETCNEPFSGKISDLLSDQEEYIKFECPKCKTEQNIKISCKYNNIENKENFLSNYIIDFELLSPFALLTKDWFKNNVDINPYFICNNYLDCYLSAIFYFYEQNLPCNFLMPEYIIGSELKVQKNNYYSIVKNEEFFDENKIKKIIEKNTPKAENSNIIIVNEDKNDNTETDLSKINIENQHEIDIDKAQKLREIARKENGYKSSFKKRSSHNKKKNVEFKIDLKNSIYKEDS